jgi:hypothetical protein
LSCYGQPGLLLTAGDCDDNNANINPLGTEICDLLDNNCNGFIDEGLDMDGDGFTICSGDCNDNNNAVYPGAVEVCNNEDDDCDETIDEGFDVDGDGFKTCNGDCNDNNPQIRPNATEVCNNVDDDCDGLIDENFDGDGDGYSACNGDCNDGNAQINPGATESCNLIDDDCDGFIDEGFDMDDDGFTPCFGDCDDTNPSINPGAPETCNTIDDNCDTIIDEGFDADNDGYYACFGDCDDNDPTVNEGATELCDGVDNDCDTFVDESFDMDGDGFATCGGDCNDNNNTIYPGATEVCNNVNDDCDGSIDEGFDLDGDGFTSCNGDCNDNNQQISPNALEVCNNVDDDCDGNIDEGFDTDGDGFTSCNGDCNENNPTIYPGAPETCNSKDDDCDGTVDEGFDLDGDGYTSCAGDCDDNNSQINPGIAEICNGINDDCDAFIDEGFDVDGDGYTTCQGDCNDNNALVNPGAAEICGNGIDDNCDATAAGDSTVFNPNFPIQATAVCGSDLSLIAGPQLINACGNEVVSYQDEYVNGGCGGIIIREWRAHRGALLIAVFQQLITLTDDIIPTIVCPSDITATAGIFGSTSVSYSATASDNCSSVNVSYVPASGSSFGVGTTLVTASAVDNCGNIATCTFNVTVYPFFPSTYYQDLDGDGYGNPAVTQFTNIPPPGYVTNSSDCNDNNAAVNPIAIEICNGFDDNCDSIVDEGCCTISIALQPNNAPCLNVNNGSITVSISNGTAPYSYLWSNGATTSSLSNLAAGVYSVTVTDGNGCQASGNATVLNLGGTAPAALTVINGPYGVCRSTSGHVFSVTPVAGATSYLWTLPNGASGSSTTNSITLSFSNQYNTGNLCVRAVNACGQSASFCRSVVAFTTNPTVPSNIIGNAINVCANTFQTFSINPVANATSYTWTAPANSLIVFGQGTTSVSIQFGPNFVSTGTVSVRSVNCFGQSANRTMTVYSIPGLPAAISGPTTAVCASSTQTYSVASLAGATSYTWTVPAGAVINSGQGTTSINVTFAANFTSGVVSVRGVSSCGTGAVRSTNVYSVPSLSGAVTGQAASLCAGGNFTYSIAAAAGALGYTWTLPAGCSLVSQNNNSVVINVPANFNTGSICVRAFNACGNSVSKCLTLNGKPATPASITGPASVCPLQTGIAFSTPQIASDTYTWTVPASCSITAGQGTNNATVTWGSVAGTIAVKAVNACGTSANRSKSVAIAACMEEEETNSDLNQKFDVDAIELRVFPNPSDGHFVIQSNSIGSFAIYNEVGQMVKSFSLNSDNMFTQEIDGLSTGFYFLKGMNESEGIVEKIVVTAK